MLLLAQPAPATRTPHPPTCWRLVSDTVLFQRRCTATRRFCSLPTPLVAPYPLPPCGSRRAEVSSEQRAASRSGWGEGEVGEGLGWWAGRLPHGQAPPHHSPPHPPTHLHHQVEHV